MVGAVRFELTTSCTRSKRASQTTLRPDKLVLKDAMPDAKCNLKFHPTGVGQVVPWFYFGVAGKIFITRLVPHASVRIDAILGTGFAPQIIHQIMAKNTWLLIFVAVVLATAYVVFFTDWFRPHTVTIFHTCRNVRFRQGQENNQPAVIFGLTRPLKITEIKVVVLADYQANHNVLPLWHLVASSNAVPEKTFIYGQHIRGLKPEVPGTHAQPLTNDVTYRLLLTAGNLRGEHDFMLK